jgi:hypothetical protein
VTAMSKSNVYPLVIPPGCGYPMFVPARPTKSKFLPWGRRAPQIGCESDEYFRRRATTHSVASVDVDDPSESSGSYPRIINALTKENM